MVKKTRESRSRRFYEGLIESRRYTEALIKENAELRDRLAAKRYKLIDKLVNSAYHVLPPYRRQQPVLTSPDKIAKDSNKQPAPKRQITPGKVDIINVNFYNWDGDTVFKGGAERYIYDLAVLLKSLGYHPTIYQGAKHDFQKTFRGIKVVGVKMSYADPKTMSPKYHELCRDAELVIASPLDLAYSFDDDIPIIGINHGVTSDWLSNRIDYTNLIATVEQFIPLENLAECVCVDTNYINLVRNYDHNLSQKLTFIPNYYDAKEFHPNPADQNPRKITCVYPRRIYAPRGYDITITAFRHLLKTYPDLELRFIGQYHTAKEQARVEKLIQQFPKQVSHAEYPMEKMYKAYEEADIVLVPTRCSEGTSLSCIEGLASQSAVIATNVGGLPNLIIDHFNGLLISPTSVALEEAVAELVEHPQLRLRLAKNGAAVAKQSFEKALWEERWRTVLSRYLHSPRIDD